MIKQMAILARRDGATADDFRSRWSARHAELVTALPSLVRYVQNDILRALPRRHLPPLALAIDGIEELWFDSLTALRMAASPPAARAAPRHGDFVGSKSAFIVRETVVYDTTAADAASREKRISVLQRKAAMSVEQFQSYWSTTHLALARAHRHADRYVQNHVVETLQRTELPLALPEIDGFGEFLTADLEQTHATYGTVSGRAMTEDAHHFLDAVSTYLVVAREIPVPAGRA